MVVAACSPRTHGPLFQDTLTQAGLNKYLFEMANIRNQCSWVHSHDWDRATEKAKDLVRLAVVKAAMLEPLEEPTAGVTPRILIIGGGLSGMRAALALAEMGVESVILEKSGELGGNLNDLHSLFPGDTKASDVIEPLKERVREEGLITVLTEAELLGVDGYIGNFRARVRTPKGERELEFGTAIIATGFKEIDIEGRFSYGKSPKIITQLQLERMLREGRVPRLKSAVMGNCAGAMDERRPYCCRIGCGVAIKNAKLLKQLNPGADVTLLYRDIRVFGKEEEEYYADVIEKYGVKIIRYDPERAPEVVVDERGGVRVNVTDAIYGDEYVLPADLVVLTAQTEGNVATEQIKQFFKVPAGLGNFFTEAHAKIRPLDFSSDGVYICGSAHYPKNLADTIAQAEGAASRAAIPIMRGSVSSEGIVSVVNEELCSGCGICIEVCPYKAPQFVEGKKVVRISKTLCKGCGSCAAACPSKAVTQRGYKDNQMYSMLLSLVYGGV